MNFFVYFIDPMQKFNYFMFLNRSYFNDFSALPKNFQRNVINFEQQQAWSNYCFSIMQMSHMLIPPPASRRTEEQGVGIKKEENSNFYYLIIETDDRFPFLFFFFFAKIALFIIFFRNSFYF